MPAWACLVLASLAMSQKLWSKTLKNYNVGCFAVVRSDCLLNAVREKEREIREKQQLRN